jgi:hypothetical protein
MNPIPPSNQGTPSPKPNNEGPNPYKVTEVKETDSSGSGFKSRVRKAAFLSAAFTVPLVAADVAKSELSDGVPTTRQSLVKHSSNALKTYGKIGALAGSISAFAPRPTRKDDDDDDYSTSA